MNIKEIIEQSRALEISLRDLRENLEKECQDKLGKERSEEKSENSEVLYDARFLQQESDDLLRYL